MFANVLQDMVAPEEVILALSKPTTTALTTLAATVQDTNPRTSPRRILIPPVEPTPLVKPTPLATPTPPVTPIPPVEVVRRKAGTTPPVTAEEVTSLTAATTEAVMVAEAITVRAMAKNIVIRNITMTRLMVLRG